MNIFRTLRRVSVVRTVHLNSGLAWRSKMMFVRPLLQMGAIMLRARNGRKRNDNDDDRRATSGTTGTKWETDPVGHLRVSTGTADATSRAGLPCHRARAGISVPFMTNESGASTASSPIVIP